MRSITLKMVLAFLGLALVSIVLIVLLARWNTGTEFSRFVSDRRGADLVQNLADYYSTHRSWDGVGKTIVTETVPQMSEGGPPREPFFTLADNNGRVISAGPGYRVGEQIQPSGLKQGISIEVDGERVGTLVMGRIPFERNPREEEFHPAHQPDAGLQRPGSFRCGLADRHISLPDAYPPYPRTDRGNPCGRGRQPGLASSSPL